MDGMGPRPLDRKVGRLANCCSLLGRLRYLLPKIQYRVCVPRHPRAQSEHPVRKVCQFRVLACPCRLGRRLSDCSENQCLFLSNAVAQNQNLPFFSSLSPLFCLSDICGCIALASKHLIQLAELSIASHLISAKLIL